ncbi:MAG: lysine 2,3-aminomutase [Planctomycetes bacterium]|jgi:KamA family protein|nr:lysine 2,3-aminomutase [Planctomycetota bacterium]
MHGATPSGARNYRAYTKRNIDHLPQLEKLDPDERLSMKAVAQVLPFRVNPYVLTELIDWDRAPEDPIYQLSFPQPGMLEPDDLARMRDLLARESPETEIDAAAHRIRVRLNPHPAGQMEYNVPHLEGVPLPGMQHKYRETVLFFPSQGQTCHAYCTYCFRWAQFTGMEELKFAHRETTMLVRYLKEHPEVTDVLFTGGDPLIMSAAVLRRYVAALLDPELAHVTNIRIGTKAISWWPNRFLDDPGADDTLRLFEEVVRSGRHLAFMAHVTHPRELATEAAREATRRILATGAVIRAQAPIVRHVNDRASVWAEMWREEVRLGMVPYYMFIARNTGAKRYFEVPLARAHEIFGRAFRQVSGLARTVRGPSMSALPGKVLISGVARIGEEQAFVLKFLQSREPSWVGRPFFARYDPEAAWLTDLEPAFGARKFFYRDALDEILAARRAPAWHEPLRSRSPRAEFGSVEWE